MIGYSQTYCVHCGAPVLMSFTSFFLSDPLCKSCSSQKYQANKKTTNADRRSRRHARRVLNSKRSSQGAPSLSLRSLKTKTNSREPGKRIPSRSVERKIVMSREEKPVLKNPYVSQPKIILRKGTKT